MSANRIVALMLAFAALWAAEEALTGWVMGRLPPLQVIWLRFALHLLMLLLWFGWRRPASLWRTRRPVLQVARSLMLLGMPACWLLASRYGVDADTLLAVFWFSPLLIPCVASVFLRERVPLSLWVAAGVACVGAVMLIGPVRMEMPPLRLFVFPIGMALCFSLFFVMTRALRDESTPANLFYVALGVLVLLAPLVPAGWVSPGLREWTALVGVAGLGLAGLFALECLAAARPTAQLAPLLGLQLPFAFGILWLQGQHDIGSNTLLGLLGIGAAAAFAWLHDGQRQSRNGRGVDIAAIVRDTMPSRLQPIPITMPTGAPLAEARERGTRKRGVP